MPEMELTVGKTYLTRNGKIVKITHRSFLHPGTFISNKFTPYGLRGLVFRGDVDDPWDILREVLGDSHYFAYGVDHTGAVWLRELMSGKDIFLSIDESTKLLPQLQAETHLLDVFVQPYFNQGVRLAAPSVPNHVSVLDVDLEQREEPITFSVKHKRRLYTITVVPDDDDIRVVVGTSL